MKTAHYILISAFVLGCILLYLFRPENEKIELPNLDFLESDNEYNWLVENQPTPTSNLVIETDKDLEPYYYFHLNCQCYSYPKSYFDTTQNKYYFTFEDVPEGKLTMSLVSEFHESFDTTISHYKVDTVAILGTIYEKYSLKTKANTVFNALENNLPMKLMFSYNEPEANTCYQFNKKANSSLIYKWQNGKIVDSMEIDYSIFKSKLKKLIRMNENPSRRKAKSYINDKGEEIHEVIFTTSAHFGTISVQIENNIYSISGSRFDMEGDQYMFFEEFCVAFFQPQFQMKI